MPIAPPRLCGCGRVIPSGQKCPQCSKRKNLRFRTDAIDREYGKQAWRKLALSIIERDQGRCHYCGLPGADTAHHVLEKRNGGTDDPSNLRAIHRRCHNKLHGKRG